MDFGSCFAGSARAAREERLDPHAMGVKQRAGTLVQPGDPLKLIQGG